MSACRPPLAEKWDCCRAVDSWSVVLLSIRRPTWRCTLVVVMYSQLRVLFERLTIVSSYGPIHCFTDQCNVERNVFWLRLLAGFPQLNFRPMYGDGGDGMLSSRLGLFYQLSDLAGYWGRWMLSPCLGLYYLLSGLCRIMGEMDAVSLSGSILPAFRPCWILGEMGCCLLVWASTTCFQASAG